MTRTALVTGVGGQDGVYLARLLVEEGTTVVGTVQPDVPHTTVPYLGEVEVLEHDVRDTEGFSDLLHRHRPDEVYNLAGFSSVGASWDHAELVADVNGEAVGRMLALIAEADWPVHFFQASSAEELATAPDSPYALAKAAAHEYVVAAREQGVFACAGMLYNHESPVRGLQFVTRKITRAAAEISLGKREHVHLGNLNVRRDWGHAIDYVEAMRAMLRHSSPEDLTIATGQSHSLEDLLTLAFGAAGLGDPWPYVEQDPALIRPADAPAMVGDASRTTELLGWRPTVSFAETVAHMVAVDVRRLESGVEEHPDYLAP